MIARTLSSLFIVLCILIAGHLARPVSIAGVELLDNGEVSDVVDGPDPTVIQIGDRIIAVNGKPYSGNEMLAKRVSPFDATAEVRTVSLENAQRASVFARQLDDALPDILQPTNYLLTIDGAPAYGATPSAVARALQEYEQVEVVAVPTENVHDRTLALERGWPPLMAIVASAVALLALLILWGGAPLLGMTLGLAAAGAALWLDVAYPAARVVGLGVLCLAAASAAWMALQNAAFGGKNRGQRALRHEGEDAESNLLIALQRAEEHVGAPLYIIVGSARQAVEIKRDYERLVVAAADTVLTATLSMLSTEGGVFPRVDVGENVRDPWGDPLQDLDVSVQIAAAVPMRGYGRTQDRWAFVIARTTDTPSSTALLGDLAEIVEQWEYTGVRESISMQATHGLLDLVDAAPADRRSQDTTTTASSRETSTSSAYSNVDAPVHSSLEHVSEGVSIPRVITREELARRKDAPNHDGDDMTSNVSRTERRNVSDGPASSRPQPTASAPSSALPSSATAPPQRSSLDDMSEGVGIPRVVSRAELERRTSGGTDKGTEPDTASPHSASPQHAPTTEAQQHTSVSRNHSHEGMRAWAGHLQRRLRAEYPVDDPRYCVDDDWARLEPLLNSGAPSLIYGEAGTGKEFAVRFVNEQSPRADFPVAVIDCADLSEAAVELELFGLQEEPGVISGIVGGALILKSPLHLSSAMLRSVVERLRDSDIRLFMIERQPGASVSLSSSATGERIAAQVADRIVRMPPLRERPESIVRASELMLEHFATIYAGGHARALTPAASRLLTSMELPSNYWDLQSLMRSAVVRTDDDMIDVRSLLTTHTGELSSNDVSTMTSDEERERLIATLHQTDGNKEDAAQMLGVSLDVLLRRLKRHGLM